MRTPRLGSLGLIGLALVASGWAITSSVHRHAPPALPESQTHEPALSPREEQSAGATPNLAEPRAGEPRDSTAADASDVMDLQAQRYWRDPSIDPAVLEQVFASPKPLPPQARPKAPAIMPPTREWQQLQRQEDTVAY